MNKKGFTLVELLAVIAILAILVIIALPNVMKLFNRAKEQAFTTELKEIYKTAQQQWIADSMFNTQERIYSRSSTENCSNKLDMSGRNELEYYIKLDKSGNVVAYHATDGTYQYSYSGTNLNIQDIADPMQVSKINEEDVIAISCDRVNKNVVVYPPGKTKYTVETGDVVKIENEEFYVVRRDGNDLVLLAHYNLKVGDIYVKTHGVHNGVSKTGSFTSADPGYNLQYSAAIGYRDPENLIGVLAFADTFYWNGKVGDGLQYPGNFCGNNVSTNCANILDDNSNVKQYVDAYKQILESYGVNIKEARLLNIDEAQALGCKHGTGSCDYEFAYETNYWLQNPIDDYYVGVIYGETLSSYSKSSFGFAFSFGVRPVIVI